MKQKELELEDAFFPVTLNPIYAGDMTKQPNLPGIGPSGKKIPEFKAVQRVSDGHVFAVVRSNYRLITNQQAYNLGKICFAKVFGKQNAEDMEFFNLRMPQTQSMCYMDFIAKGESVWLGGDPKYKEEEWKMYLRITNSYNKKEALKFDIGFCRWICKNGFIFDNKAIRFKYTHDRDASRISADFEFKYKAMSVVKTIFQQRIDKLRAKELDYRTFPNIVAQVFRFRPPKTEKEKEAAALREESLRHTSLYYATKNGSNAYALLNVLTDYASHPEEHVFASALDNNADTMERRVGQWMLQYMERLA